MRAKATRGFTGLGFVALTAASLMFAAPTQADVAYTLCASSGTVPMPDGEAPAIWGFSTFSGSCDPAQIPGPVLTATEGETVTVTLTSNSVGEPVSIAFPGQTGVDVVGNTYTFTAGAPGTYLYEADTNPSIQIPMGLYGALIVRPLGFPNRAYSAATTAFDTEEVLVLSEIDPDLNNNPGGFDLNDYDPLYWLINGKAYPDSDPLVVQPEETLLIRYLNAGSTHHTMTLLGRRQQVIAIDSDPLAGSPNLSQSMVSQTIPAGQTTDVLVEAPTAPSRLPLYNRQMNLTNALPTANPAHFPGGMMTFIEVPALLFFSTLNNSSVPGVCPFTVASPGASGACDDADIYAWSGAAFGRVFDATGAGLPGTADIDALVVADFDTFYMSFLDPVTLPVVGAVDDSDVVLYDAGTWSMFFDGSDVGLTADAEDVDAFEIIDNGTAILVSTVGTPAVPGITTPTPADEDLLRCVGTFGSTTTCAWTLYFEGSNVGLGASDVAPVNEDVDAAAVSGSDIYLSTRGEFTTGDPAGAPLPLSGTSGDAFVCNGVTLETPGGTTACTSFSMFLDASAEALPGSIDALDLP